MDDQTARAIGRAWQADRPWEMLTALTELDDRMGGHPGAHAAAELIAAELTSLGVRSVTVDAFDLTRWDRGDSHLRVIDPADRVFASVALPYSPPGRVEGRLVDVGGGTDEAVEAADLAGKIALVSTMTPDDRARFVHRNCLAQYFA